MIVKTAILTCLQGLDRAYRQASTPSHASLLSKLAILELCGWIEISLDNLTLTHCRRTIKAQSNIVYIETEIVAKNYGFHYTRNFRKMIIHVIGLKEFENIERKINTSTLSLFISNLNNLVTVRNGLAHTFLNFGGVMVAIDAPSVTLARVLPLYQGMKSFEKELRRI